MTDKRNFVYSLFSVPVYVSKGNEIPKDVISALPGVEVVNILADNGLMSKSKTILNQLPFNKLTPIITKQIEEYVYNFLSVDGSKLKIDIVRSWVVRHEKDHEGHTHSHNNSLFSGVFYLDVNGTSGDIQFHKAGHSHSHHLFLLDMKYRERNVYNSDVACFTPEDGDIFLFPSSTYHSISKNIFDKHRYCLAFNVMMRGEYGDKELENYIIL